MSAKRKNSGRTSSDADELPEITQEWIEGADFYVGGKRVRRGRPKLQNPRRLLSLRLPPEVIARWRATGPGWQTRMADLLARAKPRAAR